MRFKAVLAFGLGVLFVGGRLLAPVSAQRGGMFVTGAMFSRIAGK